MTGENVVVDGLLEIMENLFDGGPMVSHGTLHELTHFTDNKCEVESSKREILEKANDVAIKGWSTKRITFK